MQKVLYVFGGEKASGAEIVLDRLMRCNAAVEPHLFLSPGNYADKLVKDRPYPVTVCSPLRKLNRIETGIVPFIFKALANYITLSFKTIKYIKKNQISVVHANTVVPASYLIFAVIWSKIFLKKVRWVWSDHDLTYFSKLDYVFAAFNLKLYDRTLVVSNAVKEKYKIKKKNYKAIVLYNGLEPAYFKADELLRKSFRGQHQISKDTLVIGIAGNISVRKGQLGLIQSLMAFWEAGNNIHLLLAGGTTQEDKEYANGVLEIAYRHSGKIKYLGAVDDMLSFYNGCDVVINNSNKAGSEPLGTTIYEAMACEKVVIASDTGGSREIIDNGTDGFIFRAEDNRALQEAIRYYFNNEDHMELIRSNARKKVLNKFSVHLMIENYNRIINQITD